SDDLFWAKSIKPNSSILIIGSGYVALECASFLHEMQFDVNVMLRGKQVLSKFDHQCSSQIAEILERSGIRFFVSSTPIQYVKTSKSRICVVYQDLSKPPKDQIQVETFDHVLLAIGRIPNVSQLGLHKLKIRQDPETNKILVNSR